MASEVDICNRGLQIVGCARITSLADNSVNARAVNACYAILRDSELRAYKWNFAIKRVQLPASITAPVFTKAFAYILPADFLCLADPDPEDNSNQNDWQIEGNQIVTDLSAPLNLRYVAQITDPNLMDPLFRESLSAKIGSAICEELTQSNSKKADADSKYKDAIGTAKRINAITNRPAFPALDSWITSRL